MMVKVQRGWTALLVALFALPGEHRAAVAGEYLDSAWSVLMAGLHEKSSDRRAEAISTLDLVAEDPRALSEAEKALDDANTAVRVAAVNVLGDMNARAALPKIKSLVRDADGNLIVAIAAVLKKFNDPEGYEIYYEILTGTRKAGGGILAGIKDRKNLERMGIEEAIGFVPFGGVGLGAYYYFKRNESANSGLLALSALALANDPDPASEKALTQACYDEKDPVKVAALRALAKRGNPAVIKEIQPVMYSNKAIVSYTAAAAILHLDYGNTHKRTAQRHRK